MTPKPPLKKGVPSKARRGIFKNQVKKQMLYYQSKNKTNARYLRSNQTDAEQLLWSRIRRKQIKNIQFYRQKSIENFIVDFYAPAAKLVIEVDGRQHFEEMHLARDGQRDDVLQQLHLKILRFDNSQVLQSIDDVLDVIFNEIPDI